MIDAKVRAVLDKGAVIPACPLALNVERKLDERRQRALFRYYLAAGAGGLAVGVHTTQFEIREAKVGLYAPLLEIAAEEMNRSNSNESLIRVGGICGDTKAAVREAEIIRRLGYTAGLLNLAALGKEDDDRLIEHCQAVAEVVPLFGFYLNPSLGGRMLSYAFWRRFVEIENVVAIKVAPFDRYQSLDVVRAVAASGREDIALYTGNDDNIVLDLITPYRFNIGSKLRELRIVGGLLGHWAVWTKGAVEMLEQCHAAGEAGVSPELMRRANEVTECNAAFFDAANGFAGCRAGLHEVLRRQGLLEGVWLLNPVEGLSPGQAAEIDRVYAAYPHLNDDDFVVGHLDEWLSG